MQLERGIQALRIEVQVQLIVAVSVQTPRGSVEQHVAHGTQMRAAARHQRCWGSRQLRSQVHEIQGRLRHIDTRDRPLAAARRGR